MTALPIRRSQLKLQPFLAWLAEHGAEIGTPTNGYEVVRYRAYWKRPDRAETHIIYTKENGLLTYVGGSRVHYERFLAGEPLVQRGEQFVSKFDHRPQPEPEAEVREGLTARRRSRLLARDGEGCWFCGKLMGADVTLEHLVPRSRGGGNDSANLVLAHSSCNQTAANLSVSEKVELRTRMRASAGRNPEGEEREDGLVYGGSGSMTDDHELIARLQALRSKQKRVGPFRAAGIQRSIDNIKAQIRAASADTRPEGGDATEIAAPLASGAVPEGQTPKPSQGAEQQQCRSGR